MDGLEALNLLTVVGGGILIVAIFIRLGRRIWYYIVTPGFGWRRIDPLLLKDFALYLALTFLIVGSMAARLFGLSLRNEPFYVFTSDILALVALTLAFYVEYFYVEDPHR